VLWLLTRCRNSTLTLLLEAIYLFKWSRDLMDGSSFRREKRCISATFVSDACWSRSVR